MKDRFKFRTPIYMAYGKFKKFVYWNTESGFPAVTCREGDVFKQSEQCTGLKDKNGRLIYEGDVLILVHTESKYPVKIQWDKDSCSFGYQTQIGHFNLYHLDLTVAEVIGNIHENPELLEGQK